MLAVEPTKTLVTDQSHFLLMLDKSKPNPKARAWRLPRLGRSGVAAVEFAMVGFPFFLTLFFTFEISMDLFQQEALDAGLHLAVRQMQTGATQNTTNGATFISNYLCPNVTTVLSCNNLAISVKKLTLSSTLNMNGTDFYNFTTGTLPMTGGVLDLSNFASTSFCNIGPSQYLLVTAIYTSPSIIGNFLPAITTVSYGGSLVHPTMSQMGTVTENFLQQASSSTAASAC